MAYKVHSSIKLSPSGLLTIYKHITGRKLHASNYNYNIQNAVYLRMQHDELRGDELLRTDNAAQKTLLDTVCTLANKRKAGHLVQPAQVKEVSDFIADSISCMTTEFLDRIEQIATASGLFVLSYAVREKNEELALQEAQNGKKLISKRQATRLFWAYINRDDDKAAAQMPSPVSALNKPVVTRHIISLCNAFKIIPVTKHGTPLHTAGSSALLKQPENAVFAEYVRDKRIAIVGPSSSGIDHSGEIKNDFDIIIRMNYTGRETLADNQRDLLPAISYYNGRISNKIAADPAGAAYYLSDLDFAVIRKCSGKDRKNILRYANVRFEMRVDGLFFPGAPNMLQVIMQDLSHCRPARVKAFYVNLNLTQQLHDKNYLKSLGRTDLQARDQWRSLAKHRQITQYDYARCLYKRGLLEADTRLTEVLELGSKEYMNQLEYYENLKSRT